MAKENNIRKFIRQTLNEYITPRDLKNVEDYADDLFSDVGVDVAFTKHFLDRVNDLRNKQDITPDELKLLYQKAYDKYANMISKLNPGEERVLTDPDTQINIPFAMNWDGRSPDKDMVGKTVMRKKDFKTSEASPKLTLEKSVDEDINVPINVGDTVLGGKFKNKKIVVKDIDKNEKGDITINDKPLLRVRTIEESFNVYYTKINPTGGGVEERVLLNPEPFLHQRAANHFAKAQAKKYNIKVDTTHSAAWGIDDVIQIFTN